MFEIWRSGVAEVSLGENYSYIPPEHNIFGFAVQICDGKPLLLMLAITGFTRFTIDLFCPQKIRNLRGHSSVAFSLHVSRMDAVGGTGFVACGAQSIEGESRNHKLGVYSDVVRTTVLVEKDAFAITKSRGDVLLASHSNIFPVTVLSYFHAALVIPNPDSGYS